MKENRLWEGENVDFVAVVRAALPLAVGEVLWTDPSLVIRGEGWHLSTLSAWRVVADGLLEFSWEYRDLEERLAGLVGRSIVGVEVQSAASPVDPCLLLDDGRRLEIFSSHFLEPWTFRLPDAWLVASPTDPDWPDRRR